MRLALALALVSLVGCKSRRTDSRAAVEKVEEFAKSMCECQDKPCADKVSDEYTKWGQEMAKTAKPEDARNIDKEVVKAMTEAATKYSECYAKAVEAKPAEPVAPAEPEVDAMVVAAPARTGDVYVEHLIDDARKWLERDWPELAIVGVTAKYIRPTGVLDPKYGSIEIDLGIPDRPVVNDDPARPTGAPIAPPSENIWTDRTDCPALTWSEGDWSEGQKPCRKTRPVVGPKCLASAVWQRALAQRAPDNAVAVLAITGDSWQFSIKDPVRKVDFKARYADDCKPILEQK